MISDVLSLATCRIPLRPGSLDQLLSFYSWSLSMCTLLLRGCFEAASSWTTMIASAIVDCSASHIYLYPKGVIHRACYGHDMMKECCDGFLSLHGWNCAWQRVRWDRAPNGASLVSYQNYTGNEKQLACDVMFNTRSLAQTHFSPSGGGSGSAMSAERSGYHCGLHWLAARHVHCLLAAACLLSRRYSRLLMAVCGWLPAPAAGSRASHILPGAGRP